jgi:Protein of unknown function (DUF2690)/Helix-turn-helix domain
MPRNVTDPSAGDPADRRRQIESRADLAARLRELRSQAGSPSFRHLAKLTHYSSSTLADATSGKRLPTEPVLRAFVAACGGDTTQWVADLHRVIAAELADAQRHVGDAARRPGARRGWIAVATGACVAFGGGLAAGWAFASAPALPAPRPVASTGPFSGTPSPAPTARVADGADPAAAGCAADAQLVDKAPVELGGVQIGALELRYSPRCGAGWARLYLYPGQPTMMGQVTVRSGDGRLSSFADPLVKQVAEYTDVVVPGPGGCLSAEAVVYSAGKPAVTASLPCEPPTAK